MAEANRSRVPVKLDAAGDTHIGGRSHNEDAILLRPDLNLYVVADGAGGQNAGNVAASLATTSIAHFFEQTKKGAEDMPEFDVLGLPVPARRLSAAVHEANKEIIQIAKSSARHRGMGTTVVALLFAVDHRAVHIAYVGDSRCYRLRDGRLELLTHDHSLANDVLELRPDADDTRVQKLPPNVITRALGMSSDLRVSVRSHELAHGDRYLLCSDGLSDMVDWMQISEALGLDAEPEHRVRLLVDMAIEAGADDNVAVVVVDCEFAARKTQSATRPVRKLTPTAVPRIEAPPRMRMRSNLDSLTEESVPEIVLYEEGEDRESTPMIHVVPVESATQELADAVGPIIGPEGALPARTAPPLPSTPPPAMPRTGKIAASDLADRITADYVPVERGGAAAAPAKRVSAPRRHKPDVAVEVNGAGRTGNTVQPPKPTLEGEVKKKKKAPAIEDEPTAAREDVAGRRPKPPRAREDKKKPPPFPSRAPKQPPKSSVLGAAKPTPSPRGLLDTSDYVGEETIACHACGSVISRTAEYCLYCGATTRASGSKPS